MEQNKRILGLGLACAVLFVQVTVASDIQNPADFTVLPGEENIDSLKLNKWNVPSDGSSYVLQCDISTDKENMTFSFKKYYPHDHFALALVDNERHRVSSTGKLEVVNFPDKKAQVTITGIKNDDRAILSGDHIVVHNKAIDSNLYVKNCTFRLEYLGSTFSHRFPW